MSKPIISAFLTVFLSFVFFFAGIVKISPVLSTSIHEAMVQRFVIYTPIMKSAVESLQSFYDINFPYSDEEFRLGVAIAELGIASFLATPESDMPAGKLMAGVGATLVLVSAIALEIVADVSKNGYNFIIGFGVLLVLVLVFTVPEVIKSTGMLKKRKIEIPKK